MFWQASAAVLHAVLHAIRQEQHTTPCLPTASPAKQLLSSLVVTERGHFSPSSTTPHHSVCMCSDCKSSDQDAGQSKHSLCGRHRLQCCSRSQWVLASQILCVLDSSPSLCHGRDYDTALDALTTAQLPVHGSSSNPAAAYTPSGVQSANADMVHQNKAEKGGLGVVTVENADPKAGECELQDRIKLAQDQGKTFTQFMLAQRSEDRVAALAGMSDEERAAAFRTMSSEDRAAALADMSTALSAWPQTNATTDPASGRDGYSSPTKLSNTPKSNHLAASAAAIPKREADAQFELLREWCLVGNWEETVPRSAVTMTQISKSCCRRGEAPMRFVTAPNTVLKSVIVVLRIVL